jgi:triphosphoribosyl-dephospho-CoA synthase
LRVQARPGLTPAAIGRAATLALYDELSLSPKPGLVTLIDCGSHDDMDARTFMRSLLSLRHYFGQIAQAGFDGADFAVLERLGIDAEARMLAATGGVNTHRGAIFMLGLLCASAGTSRVSTAAWSTRPGCAMRCAGTGVRRSTDAAGVHPRCRVASPHGATGCAARPRRRRWRFPVLFETALPALTSALARGLTPHQARLDTLFHIMAVLDDSNLAHRGGLAGLRHAQRRARQFLEGGGAAGPDGLRKAHAIGSEFVAQRLSPGGAADMLSAACWITRVCASP